MMGKAVDPEPEIIIADTKKEGVEEDGVKTSEIYQTCPKPYKRDIMCDTKSKHNHAIELFNDAIQVSEDNYNTLPDNLKDKAIKEPPHLLEDLGEGDNIDTSEEDQNIIEADLWLRERERADFWLTQRKVKDPAPVWMCAVRVQGGAKCS